MPDVYVRLREGGLDGGVPIPADGRVRLTPVLVPDSEAWVTSEPTVMQVVGGVSAPVSVSPGRWRVDVVSESWARRWELDLVDDPGPVNLVTLTPVDPSTPVPWLPTEADLAFIRETREQIPRLIAEAVAEGDYTGPAGRGVVSIADPDGDGTATVTYSDGETADLPLPPGPPGDDGRTPDFGWDGTRLMVDGVPGPDLVGPMPPPPSVEWDGSHLGVGGERSPDLTGPAPSVSWSGPRLVVGGVSGPDLTGPPGAPGTVPTAQDYMVVGPGRPDAPTTTGMTAAQLNALPVGAEYRSTDGASTGAWVWRKRPTGWGVADGDTGWISIAHFFPGLAGLKLHIRRTTSHVSYRGDIPNTLFIASDAAGKALPAGFRLPSDPRTNLTLSTGSNGEAGGWLWPNHASGVVVMQGRGSLNVTLAADPSWPTTLTL